MLGTKKTNMSGKVPSGAPISAHPYFPVVVALWFAALLGIGSLVLPVALFETAVTATGISSLISAAQPPLGATARIAIAVFAAAGGAIAGLLIARRVSAAQANDTPERDVFGRSSDADHASMGAKKPISAHEELGDAGLDEPVADHAPSEGSYSGKRRALAVTDDSGPSEYLEAAPLPGGQAMVDQFDDDTVEDAAEDITSAEPEENAEPPLDLAQLTNTDHVEDHLDKGASASVVDEFETLDAQPLDEAETNEPPYDALQAAQNPLAELREELGTMTDQSNPPKFNSPQFNAQESAPAEDMPQAYNPLAGRRTPSHPNGEFAAPMETVDEFNAATNFMREDSAGSLTQDEVAPPAPEQAAQPAIADVATETNDDLRTKPLKDLGMVELVERFALAMQAKTEAKAQAAAEERHHEAAPLVFQRSNMAASAAPFVPSEPEDAGNAVAQFFASEAAEEPAAATVAQAELVTAPQEITTKPVIPVSMQPVGLDETENEDEADDMPSLSLSIRSVTPSFIPSPSPSPREVVRNESDDAAEQGDDADSGAYSSLLAMKSPFASGEEFVRVEDDEHFDGPPEPEVVFPGAERRAAPAVDGPTRDPAMETVADTAEVPAARPFDAPSESPANGPAKQPVAANPGDTERALREALEKLQRMSGAA